MKAYRPTLVAPLLLCALACVSPNTRNPSPDAPINTDRKDAPASATGGSSGGDVFVSTDEGLTIDGVTMADGPDVGLADPATCPAGQNRCGGSCVDATSRTACGVTCVVCPTDPNGVSSCDGDKCELACNAGFHRCGDRCLDNLSAASCGTACTACPAPTGGSARCDGSKCGSTCPNGTKLCAGACIPAANACNEMCGTGTHDCEGNCVSVSDVNSCGSSCTPCAPPANAEATCDGKTCGWKCRAGFHRCGERCLSDTSTGSCGPTACDACPVPPGATATCNGVACDFRCDSGRRCHDTCIGDDKPCDNLCASGYKLCGTSCVVPQAEVCDNRDNDCDGQIDEGLAQDCSNACGAGQKICSAGTWNSSGCPKAPSNSDASACGSSCAKCPGNNTANGVCQNGTCQLACKTACSGTPEACGECGGTRTCNPATCAYSACGPSCCPNPVSDRWPSISYSSSPWATVWPPETDTFPAKPTVVANPPSLVLPRDSVVSRVPLPQNSYVVSFELNLDAEFAFHAAFAPGGPYPALRRFGTGSLTLGGLTYGEREESDWKSFGAWNGQVVSGSTTKVTLFVKAGAKQVAAVAGGIKSGFVQRGELTHFQLIGSHLVLYNGSTAKARVGVLTGCAGLTDAQVQALYDGGKAYP